MKSEPGESSRLTVTEDRYRLYIDESGDHVFKQLDEPGHRCLCLLGCFFRRSEYRLFQDSLERFKQQHIPRDPDEPVILHREDIINRRNAFWRLRDPLAALSFDRDLLELIGNANFRIVAVVIDKRALRNRYPVPAHPYHLAMGFLLQRYCGLLNHLNRRGDVLAESRGGTADRLLKDSYAGVYRRGVWMTNATFFQGVLTTRELKVKPKTANIAGLQLADILAHPIRQGILMEKQCIPGPLSPFATQLIALVETKFNRHLYDGRIEGYGKVFFPK
jgi:hypothetical protein